MITLGNLSPNKGSNKQRKRVGRGPGSGFGKTAGRGHKGAKSRSGYNSKPGFEGGQMPLQRRLPKRGFFNKFGKEFRIVSLSQLDALQDYTEISNTTLVKAGIIRKGEMSKVLANGEISRAISISVDKISAQAKAKIENAGGTVNLVAATAD